MRAGNGAAVGGFCCCAHLGQARGKRSLQPAVGVGAALDRACPRATVGRQPVQASGQHGTACAILQACHAEAPRGLRVVTGGRGWLVCDLPGLRAALLLAQRDPVTLLQMAVLMHMVAPCLHGGGPPPPCCQTDADCCCCKTMASSSMPVGISCTRWTYVTRPSLATCAVLAAPA